MKKRRRIWHAVIRVGFMEEVALDINFRATSMCFLAGKKTFLASRSHANRGRERNAHDSRSKHCKDFMIKSSANWWSISYRFFLSYRIFFFLILKYMWLSNILLNIWLWLSDIFKLIQQIFVIWCINFNDQHYPRHYNIWKWRTHCLILEYFLALLVRRCMYK